MKLSVIIPVLNEEENLPHLLRAIDEAFRPRADVSLELIFVDDGSRDGTLAKLREVAGQDPRVRALSFSRNFGSHAALMAGFRHCTGDAAAYLSADLQDPPEMLLTMLDKLREGFQVVWGTREQRDDPPAARLFSRLYSSLMRRLALANMPPTGIDLCLVDRAVLRAVTRVEEKNTSVFGLIMWSGFRQTFVPYHRRARQRGTSRWTLGKKLKLFVDSFVSFSFFPIRLVSYLGLAMSALGFVYATIVAARRFFYATPVEGWSSLMVTVVTLSGLQLLMLGIVAEYLWRTFDETRKRPPYIIKEAINFERDQTSI
jgi:polyisoprenyl-phosphate glycosyltransferase